MNTELAIWQFGIIYQELQRCCQRSMHNETFTAKFTQPLTSQFQNKQKSKMADDENLLSEKNKERCIEEFDQLMPIRVPKNPKSLASVLIPIIELDNGQGPGLLYTKRSSKLSSHAREVCFPGGKKVGRTRYACLKLFVPIINNYILF